MRMSPSEKEKELAECNYYRNVIHSLCQGTCVKLNEKMWIQTETQGCEFTAAKVVDMMDYRFPRIEIYNDDNFIHCDSRLLDSRQMKELARIVAATQLGK